jgi:hypothetical protein
MVLGFEFRALCLLGRCSTFGAFDNFILFYCFFFKPHPYMIETETETVKGKKGGREEG